MSAPRRNHGRAQAEWDRMCLDKKRYPDEPVARAAVAWAIGQGVWFADRGYVYQCPNCRGWHATTSRRFHGPRAGGAITASDPYEQRESAPK